jgi:hypothetical protein
MKFEVLTVVKISMVAFLPVTPWGLQGGYQRFGGTYCPHFQYFSTEDGGSMFFRNIGAQLQVDTASQPGRSPWTILFSFSSVQRDAHFIELFFFWRRFHFMWIVHFFHVVPCSPFFLCDVASDLFSPPWYRSPSSAISFYFHVQNLLCDS